MTIQQCFEQAARELNIPEATIAISMAEAKRQFEFTVVDRELSPEASAEVVKAAKGFIRMRFRYLMAEDSKKN